MSAMKLLQEGGLPRSPGPGEGGKAMRDVLHCWGKL